MTEQPVTFKDICGEAFSKECPDAIADAQIFNYATGRENKKLVHYKCLYKNETSKNIVPLPDDRWDRGVRERAFLAESKIIRIKRCL